MRTAQKGFTLAELLIALALLGIIAAFTIPKVLQASGSQEASAKIRETVATLEQAYYNQRALNRITNGVTLYANLAPELNTIASAAADPGAAGSPYASIVHPCEGPTFLGWVQFPNGVLVSGLATGGTLVQPVVAPIPNSATTTLCIDYNGAANPNTPGQDIFLGNFQQFGDFDMAANLAYPIPTDPNDAFKSFLWGDNAQPAYSNTGAALGAPFAAAPQFGARNMMSS